jgi:hypothetical protein
MMVEDFYKNGKILDRGNAAIITGQEPTEDKFLFGSDVLIERMSIPDMKAEQRSRAAKMLPVSDWWMGPSTPKQASSKTASPVTIAYQTSETGFDEDHGPPGLPMFLAQARNVSMGISDIYDAETAVGMQAPEMLAMMPNNYQMVQTDVLSGNSGIPMLRIEDAMPGQAIYRQDVPPMQPQSYLPPHQGMLMNGYVPPPYPGSHASGSEYTQQNNFG